MKKKIIISGVIIIGLLSALVVIYKNQKIDIDITVPDYYSLAYYNYDGDFNEFYNDSYSWYKSIENKYGVYIINTSYYNGELLKIWKDENIYKAVPDKAFWYFAASPSYLRQMNIDINENDLNDAKAGVRLYLVPDTLNDDEYAVMSAYLDEEAKYKAEKGAIKTAFTENKEVKIIRYTPNGSYFTWQSDKGQPVTDDAPVIYVCTSENMKYFESESLIATGINSYIKFINKETMEKYTNANILKKYNMNFLPSSEIYKNASKVKLVDSGIEKAFE